MSIALFFLVPAGTLLGLAGIITDYFNFWRWID